MSQDPVAVFGETSGGITYGSAKPILAKVVENGTCEDEPLVMMRTDEVTKMLLDLDVIPVGSMATYDVKAVGTTITLPAELACATEVEVLNGKRVNRSTDVTQGWNLVNPSTYVDPMLAHDNPLDDEFFVPDGDNPAILRRQYNYPGLDENSWVRVTGPKAYRPITGDNDYLIIQNLLALKYGIMAIERIENGNGDEGDKLLAKAEGLLTAEVKKYQLDPTRSLKRKAHYDNDLLTFKEGTFGYIRARMAHEITGALNHGKSELTRILEQAEMRLMEKGTPVGTIEQFHAQVFEGQILFPARVKTVIAANYGCGPIDIRSMLYAYQKNGPGMECSCASYLIDEGDVYFKDTGQRRRKYRLHSAEYLPYGHTSTSSSGTLTVNDGDYVGEDTRVVAIPGGVALECRDDNGNWIRQWEQTE